MEERIKGQRYRREWNEGEKEAKTKERRQEVKGTGLS